MSWVTRFHTVLLIKRAPGWPGLGSGGAVRRIAACDLLKTDTIFTPGVHNGFLCSIAM